MRSVLSTSTTCLRNWINSMNRITKEQLSELSHKDQVRFALFCAYQLKDQWVSPSGCMNALKVVEMWLEDKANIEECSKATKIFWTYCHNEDMVVLYALAATHFCVYTSYVSISENAMLASKFVISHIAPSPNSTHFVIQEQRDYYNELRYIDNIFEDIVLKEIV
jgi:hypothetical protein